MSARNFNNFHLGDDVYELAGGMIVDLAEKAGLNPYGSGPQSEVMGELVGVLGKNKVLRDAEPIDFLTIPQAARYVDQSGVLLPLNRSLHTPDKQVPEGTSRIMTANVANWQDKTADYLVELAKTLTSDVTVYGAAGNRVMKQPTELANKNVKEFQQAYGHLPIESQYLETFVLPRLNEAGYYVSFEAYDTGVGDEIAAEFVEKHPELFEPGVAVSFASVATNGFQTLLQFRNAAISNNEDYDPKDAPQTYAESNGRKVAKTAKQIKNAQAYQSPQPALRSGVLRGKLLHIAAGGK